MFSNEIQIQRLADRKNLLKQRDPVANAKIIKKIERQLRKLTNVN